MDSGYSTGSRRKTLPVLLANDGRKVESHKIEPDWTEKEEAWAMRKVDLTIIPWLTLCYTSLNIDRLNISNAAIINAETPTHTLAFDLGLNGDQFNWAVSIFFFGYVLFEIPSNLILTRVSPSGWIGRILASWGIFAACMGATQNYAGLLAVRALTGCMEAGFAPGAALYLSYWYKKYEVSSRWAYMFGGGLVFSSTGGLIAFGVANMDGLGGLSGWRWLFILEGSASALIGVITMFLLPDYPQTCRFLTLREKEIVVGRLPPTGPSVAARRLRLADILNDFKDWRMYALSFALMLHLTTVFSIAYFLPIVIKLLGFQSTTAQLLSIPPFLFSALWILLINWSSDRHQEKALHGLLCIIPPIVGYMLLAFLHIDTQTPYTRYSLLFLVAMSNGLVPLVVGLSTISTKGTGRTAVRSAFTVACGNIGGAIGGQIYRNDDAPLYTRGHVINGSLIIGVLVLFLLAVVSLIREGEYVGPRANYTVYERGGLEIDGDKLIRLERVVETTDEVEEVYSGER
ncbi:MFS general substrate transporter [Gonapodya prolifera JEL478]|uniref:MFS general substrate transporter n=1 Tax=Gonapodya prolifera (strain JEL478) TaxID=1344416 RepID=A0A139ALG6_GONPJ|nr:MFS general substrate transporter [Gonapodya prolifera JEL478]|eukprot:KXS17384.1 MFS general substrate transporter [Gonapodya prolifera JEL478]